MLTMRNNLMIAGIIVLLAGTGILARFVDHPPNFVPLAAIALVSAFYLSSRASCLIPIGVMLVSDLFIGFYDPLVMISVYGSYLLIWGLGRLSRASAGKLVLLPATLAGSVLFFTFTNLAVWAFTPLYDKTASGLYLAYAMAIPFFKWTLSADVFYMAVFVAIIEAAFVMARARAKTRNKPAFKY